MRIFLILALLLCPKANSSEPQKIVVFGAGYVGLVTGSCLAKYGHKVTFIEINPEKVVFLKSKKVPFLEAGLEELLCLGLDKGLIEIKAEIGAEILEADIAFIAVQTPTDEKGRPQLHAVEDALLKIISSIAKRKKKLIVSIRSTILPDSFRELQRYCELYSKDLSLVMNPEFLRESTAVRNFFQPSFCVAGGSDLKAVQAVLDLYEEISSKRYALSGESACLLKYACNAFHAAKPGSPIIISARGCHFA